MTIFMYIYLFFSIIAVILTLDIFINKIVQDMKANGYMPLGILIAAAVVGILMAAIAALFSLISCLVIFFIEEIREESRILNPIWKKFVKFLTKEIRF